MMSFWVRVAITLFVAKGVQSYGFLEIQLIKYTNKYGRSKNGSRCPRTSGNHDLYRCTNIFKLRLSSGSFSESITTQAFQEAAYAKTVKFRNRLNVNKSNPWKINLTRVESVYDFEFNITVDGKFFDRINYTLNTTDYFPGSKRLTITNEKSSYYIKELELRVRAYCDSKYLEPQCVKSACIPRDDESGHYFCNKDGKKVCLVGWKNITSGCLEVNTTSAPSTGTLEIHLLKYTNKYGRSNSGSRCPKDTNSQELYRCTNIFKLRLSSGTFSESITTLAFQEAVYAKTVNFRVRLNDKISNPWKIKLPRIESMYDFEFNITVDGQFFDRINYTFNMTNYFAGGKRLIITNEKHSDYVKKLELRVSAYCNDPAYLEPHCDKKGCQPRDDELGHYFCNKKGEKVCLAGWKNEKSGCLEADIKTTSIAQSSYSTKAPKQTEATPQISSSRSATLNTKLPNKSGFPHVKPSKKSSQSISRINPSTSRRQEITLTQCNNTSGLYPNGGKENIRGSARDATQISLLGFTIISFLLAAVLLACIVWRREKFTKKSEYMDERIAELQMGKVGHNFTADRRERVVPNTLTDNNKSNTINNKRNQLHYEVPEEFEGFNNTLTGRALQSQTGLSNSFKTVDETKLTKLPTHVYEDLPETVISNTLDTSAIGTAESSIFPPLPPKKMLIPKQNSKRKISEWYESLTSPPSKNSSSSFIKSSQNSVCANHFDKQERATTLPISNLSMPNSYETIRSYVENDGYVSQQNYIVSSKWQKSHGFNNYAFVSQPEYE